MQVYCRLLWLSLFHQVSQRVKKYHSTSMYLHSWVESGIERVKFLAKDTTQWTGLKRAWTQPFNPDSTAMLPMCNILLTYKQEPPEIHIAFCLISYFWFIFKLPIIIIIIIIKNTHLLLRFGMVHPSEWDRMEWGLLCHTNPDLSQALQWTIRMMIENMKEEKKVEFSTLHRLFMWLTLLVTFALVSLWFTCRYMHL